MTEIIRGVTFPGSAKSETRSNGDVACLRTASVQAEIDWDDLIYISPTHVSRMDQWVAPNDVMISMANSYALVGRVAMVREVPQKATFGAFLAAIRPVLIDPYFLLDVLRSPRMQAAFRASSSQTTNIANISLGRMRPLPFPLPPLAEQKRIVAKVDELMGVCDRLESQQRERETQSSQLSRASLARFAETSTPANLQYLFHPSYDISPADLRKSILTLAVQGILVPQDPNDEPAQSDFDALVRTRENSSLKRTKIDGEVTAEDPFIPESWISVCLGELVSIRTGFAFKSTDYAEHGTLILRVTNINPDGSFDTSNAVFLPDAKIDEKIRGFLLEEHELLIVMVGSSLGKIGQVVPGILPSLLNQNIWRLKPYSERLDFRFLRLALHDLNENPIQITRSTHGHLATGTYAASKVPFPPLAEQRRIVAKVDELMKLVDALESQLAASRAASVRLLSALVAELSAA